MEICRLCLYKGDKVPVISIFDSNHDNLADRIEKCVSIKVTKNEKIPSLICNTCLEQVRQWELFRENCQKSDDTLRSWYGIEKNVIDDTVVEEVVTTISSDVEDIKDTLQNEEYGDVTEKKTKQNDNKKKKRTLVAENNRNEFEEELDESMFDDSYQLNVTNIYTCEICFREYRNCVEYLDHQPTHDGELVFKCSRCSEVFSSRGELVAHDSNHRMPCRQCGKLISKSSMRLHLVRHTDKYKCSECPGRFNSRACLAQHTITVHTDIKNHVCDTCGKRFSSQTAMRVHIKSHSDQRRYQCKQCQYAGRTASALYIHMSTHANDLCVCEVCSKTFKSMRNLNDHLRRVHSKVKKHECSYCHRRFVDKYVLRVHLRCHTGVRPYRCNECDKSFIRSDNLKEHMLIHGKREMYNCGVCKKKFASRRGIARHSCSSNVSR